ncbi:hypothetical protein SELMODRAFT_406816 [Selaginella moellendorffii]|uniref:Uncharacterized protein n=1 Tax=Selaginella moellendorffii TaxID=88036 RepID=D8R311_SELML|nr:hypothetical protein SELMODRAFT_406816 [Selaginella moellendorffii]
MRDVGYLTPVNKDVQVSLKVYNSKVYVTWYKLIEWCWARAGSDETGCLSERCEEGPYFGITYADLRSGVYSLDEKTHRDLVKAVRAKVKRQIKMPKFRRRSSSGDHRGNPSSHRPMWFANALQQAAAGEARRNGFPTCITNWWSGSRVHHREIEIKDYKVWEPDCCVNLFRFEVVYIEQLLRDYKAQEGAAQEIVARRCEPIDFEEERGMFRHMRSSRRQVFVVATLLDELSLDSDFKNSLLMRCMITTSRPSEAMTNLHLRNAPIPAADHGSMELEPEALQRCPVKWDLAKAQSLLQAIIQDPSHRKSDAM